MGIVATVYSPNYYTQENFWKEIQMTGLAPEWHGRPLQRLGLVGPVSPDRLRNVLSGRSPDGLVQLVRSAANGKDRFGTELLFCAPSSFSALLATNPRERWGEIFKAHETARQKTMTEVLANGFSARRGQGGQEQTECLVAAVNLPNGYSRLGSPMIHSHDIVLKQGFCPDDEKTRVAQVDKLFQRQRQIRADYLLHLSNECTQKLGLTVERKNNSFSVAGMSEPFLKEIAPTRSEIGQYLVDRNLRDTPAAREIAAKVLRPEKQVYEAGLLETHWRTVAEKHNVQLPIQSSAKKELGANVREMKAYGLAGNATNDWASQRNSVDKASFQLEVTRSAFGSGLTPKEIEKAVDRVLERPEAFGLKVIDRHPESIIYQSQSSNRTTASSFSESKNPSASEIKNDGQFYQQKSAETKFNIQSKSQSAETNPNNLKGEESKLYPKSNSAPEQEPITVSANDREKLRDELNRRIQGDTQQASQTTSSPSESVASPLKSTFSERIQERASQFYNRLRPERIIVVDAAAESNNPRSLNRLCANLQQTPLATCHARVYDRIWGKWFSNTDQMLSYAEAVFREERKPKEHLNSRTRVIIENAEKANPDSLNFVNSVAMTTNAKVQEKKPDTPSPATKSPQETNRQTEQPKTEQRNQTPPTPPPAPPAPTPSPSR